MSCWILLKKKQKKSRDRHGKSLLPAMRKPLPVLSLLIFLGIGAACGIPEYEYLAEPIADAGIDTNIRFSHNLENDVSYFMGYSLFYRLYAAKDSSSPPNISSLKSDSTLTYAEIQDNGYRSFYGGTPELKIADAEKALNIEYNMLVTEISNNSDGFLQVEDINGYVTSVSLGRDVNTKTGFGRDDFYGGDDGDDDVPDDYSSEKATLFIAVFGCAEGFSGSGPVRSYVEYLGLYPLETNYQSGGR